MPAPISCSVVQLRLPPSMSDALAVVPPMSKLITLAKPTRSPTRCAATTPAAGPDSTMRTGDSAALSKDMTPPLDCMMRKGAAIPAERALPDREFR